MTNPLSQTINELARQATMKFRGEDVARVHRILGEVTRGHRIEVDCPLPAWDSDAMGVALRRVDRDKTRAGERRKYKRTASFVLDARELEDEAAIRAKAGIAVAAINLTVLCQIREVKERTAPPPEAAHEP